MAPAIKSIPLPVATAADTVDQIVVASKRTNKAFPLRRTFLQQVADKQIRPGPLASLVTATDRRALLLFLLLLTKTSAPPWDAGLPAAVWARAIGLDLPQSKTATSAISKVWSRLEDRKLISRRRQRRMIFVTLLSEDGSGQPYSPPGETNESYLKVPTALWQSGPNNDSRWHQVLSLPELAVLLIGRSLGDGFRLPFEQGPAWYGISADTIERGVHGLQKHGLLTTDPTFKKAPLSPCGYTAEHRHTLLAPFGPIGKDSRSRPKRGTRSK